MTDVALHHLGVADLADVVAPGSVDLVLTDPPYPAKYDALLPPLAQLCAHALAPGGSAVVMVGQRQLPALFAAFAGTDLSYRWTFCKWNMGASGPMYPLRLWAEWKPLVWFSRSPTVKLRRWMPDVLRYPREGNELHKWQQGLQQFYDLTLAFSGSRATVCDPFLGAGTTAVAAALLRRRFIGCDVDAACLVKTRARLDAVADNPALAAIVPPPVVSPSGR